MTANGQMQPEDERKQFKIEQFKSLRSEIEDRFKDTRTLEVYVLIGLVAYYAWIMTHCLPDLYVPIQWIIPIILPLLGFWRTWENMIRLGKIAEFVRKTEKDILVDQTWLGWEHFLESRKNWRDAPGSYWATWVVVFVGTLIIALFGTDLNSQTCKAAREGPSPKASLACDKIAIEPTYLIDIKKGSRFIPRYAAALANPPLRRGDLRRRAA
jgi:hypothetical protein